MLRRWLTFWLFAFALLFGQMGALAHATGHLAKSDPGLPDHVCELCLTQGHLGSAVTSSPPTMPVFDAIFGWWRPAEAGIAAIHSPVARARAPPAAV